jgi:signal transduction histidine kinase
VNRQSIRVRLATWNALLVIVTFATTGGGAWLAMRDSLSLGAACEEGHILAQAAGLRFTTAIPQSCDTIGDPEGLRRLFLILLDNAVKYTPAGRAVGVIMTIHDLAVTATRRTSRAAFIVVL